MSHPRGGRQGDLVSVARVDNVVEASVIRQILEDAGIRCMVRNGDALSAYSLGTVARAIEILVRSDDAAQAQRLIRVDGGPSDPAE